VQFTGKSRFDFNQVAWEQRETRRWQPHLHLHRHIKYYIAFCLFCLIFVDTFLFFNRRRMKPSVHRQKSVQTIPKPSQSQKP
jgi:hypothetical protein